MRENSATHAGDESKGNRNKLGTQSPPAIVSAAHVKIVPSGYTIIARLSRSRQVFRARQTIKTVAPLPIHFCCRLDIACEFVIIFFTESANKSNFNIKHVRRRVKDVSSIHFISSYNHPRNMNKYIIICCAIWTLELFFTSNVYVNSGKYIYLQKPRIPTRTIRLLIYDFIMNKNRLRHNGK